jgi:uncharacterized caspase-like protein
MFAKQSLAIGINEHNPSRLNLMPCINDATDVTKSLMSMGFRAHCVTNTDLNMMKSAIGKFIASIRPGAVAFFYFSGHGVQFNGNNYLVPSDALGLNGPNLQSTAIDAQKLIYDLHARKPRLVICILDCCRTDAPMDTIDARRFDRGVVAGTKAGLAPMHAPPATLIAFACAAGEAASAGSDNGRNSLYTYHLLRHMRRPNMDFENVLRRVAAGVEKESKNGQIPYRYSSCNEFIYLVNGYAHKRLHGSNHEQYPGMIGKQNTISLMIIVS